MLGLLAYNRAYFAKREQDYKAAYDFIVLAQQFNSDSRSNVNLEIGLYFSWGGQLFSKKEYVEAFAVFADGYYRYPENEKLLKNTFVSFYKSLENLWLKKNWPESARLIEEMIELDVFRERDNRNMKKILKNWLLYFGQKEERQFYKQVKGLLDKFNT